MTILTDGLYCADALMSHSRALDEIVELETNLLDAAALQIQFQYQVIKRLEKALQSYVDNKGDDIQRLTDATAALNLINLRTENE